MCTHHPLRISFLSAEEQRNYPMHTYRCENCRQLITATFIPIGIEAPLQVAPEAPPQVAPEAPPQVAPEAPPQVAHISPHNCMTFTVSCPVIVGIKQSFSVTWST